MKGYKSDAINVGVSYDLRDNLTFFVQGDYLHAKAQNYFGMADFSGIAWSVYTGLQYSLPYGVTFEAGWKHEWVRLKYNFPAGQFGEGSVPGTYPGRADSIYGLIGFEF
jgi:predicted porin